MRFFALIAAIAAFAAQPAAAAPVALPTAVLSAEATETFNDDYGMRELLTLQEMIATALESALERRGATIDQSAGVRFETTIVSAKPNKPTIEQLRDQPGLDYFASISLGGADLQGRFVGPNGDTLARVAHRYYSDDLTSFPPLTTWQDARRAIRAFADEAADAYVAKIATP